MKVTVEVNDHVLVCSSSTDPMNVEIVIDGKPTVVNGTDLTSAIDRCLRADYRGKRKYNSHPYAF